MAMLKTFVCLAATAMLVQLVMTATYTVGGANGGWDSSTDLQSWVASQKFSVGDNLLFQYTPNHDVLEVTKADYDSCQASSPLRTYSDGNTVVPLTSPGKRYFICGTLGHCSQGMQIEINTLATSPSTPPSASPASKTSPSPAKAPELATGSSSQSPEISPSATPSVSPVPETSPSPAKTPESAPVSPSPADVTTMETPETASSPSGPLPSPANRNRFQTCLTFGFGFLLVVLLSL
ncbi:Basic helix-loop-helix DNA-binding superfamily protein [Hibiscus syriacus]|uniref:Basic helix-loop-helix DNA-binding superfamily protein n=1 Tax=Hibiscus syriacus TaxID=106335 RepID=A0A6A3A2D0_HIBSY|nr:uclacyanin 1-like [Hibiscus syriacus]KAE8698480.1 Basic helix-loop-helix DNA-binding superfamily protein [Hibiscus syriacus]